MSTQLTPNFRLVRCPNCNVLLQESEDVPLYRCGGCDTILKAKRKRNGTKDRESNKQGTDTIQTKVSERCSEVTNSRRSNQEETLPPTGEMPLQKHVGSDQNEIEKDIDRQQSPDFNFSGELSSQLKCQGNGGGSPKAKAEIEAKQDDTAADEKNGSNQNESGHCNGKPCGGVILANEVASSTDLNRQSEEPSPGPEAHSEVGENCLEKNNKWNQNEYGHFPGKQAGVPGYSDEVASSTELHHCREETLPVGGSLCQVVENRNCLEQDNETDQIEFGDCKRERPGDVKLSDEVSSSTELIRQEIEDLSPMVGAITGLDENPKSCFIPGSFTDSAREQIEFEDCEEWRPGNLKLPTEVSSSTELTCQEIEDSAPGGTNTGLNDNSNSRFMPADELSSSTELTGQEIEDSSPVVRANTGLNDNYNSGCISGSSTGHERQQIEFEDCKRECPEDVNSHLNEVSSSTELTCQEIEYSSPVVPTVGTNTGLDKNLKNCSIPGSSTDKNLLVLDMMDSENTAQRSSGESIITDNLMSPHVEQPEQSEKRTSTSALDQMRSGDASDNIALTNPCSGFSATLQDLPNSPTIRSSNAYDGSVSSYDGTDDQVPRKHLHLSSRQVMEAGSLDARITPRSRRGQLTHKITSGHAEKQHNGWASLSISLENKKHAMKGRKWNQDDFLEARRHGHTIRSRMNFETYEHLPRVPLYSRSPSIDYENGNPSSCGRSAFVCSTSLHPPNATEYPEQEKMELLKMVYELQNQLKKVLISKEKANGRYPGVDGKGKQVPSYYTSLSPVSKMYDGLCCASYPRRCHRGKFCPCQTRTSLQPFSAEATIGRCQGEPSCIHCRPQDWLYSAPLPPHNVYMKSHCTARPSPRYQSLYAYSPSSPRHYAGSECSLQSYDTMSDNLSHIHHEEKGYYGERHNLVKRHVRPASGGAPFIVCYRCGGLLHLPADFLLFNRRYHQLKCSICSRVLKFSLQNGARMVPYSEYTPSAMAPPPSEVDYHSDATNGGELASASHVPNADVVSCSDDYGLFQSGSTEGEISAALPSHTRETYCNDRRISSGSSLDHIRERKRPVFRESLNRYWDPVQTSDGASSSKADKLSSETEVLPRASSPLYRLMEYASPREVMNS